MISYIIIDIFEDITTWIFILVLIILYLILVLIPTIISINIYKWLAKKGYKKIGIGVISIIVFWTVYSVYTAFFPTKQFFISEFETKTKIDFPDSGIIVLKESSYPDLHGDYTVKILFKSDSIDFNKILSIIEKNNNYEKDTFEFKFDFEDNKFKFNQIELGFTNGFLINKVSETTELNFNKKEKLIYFKTSNW